MNRIELIRWFVLNEISDDYENVDQVILASVANRVAGYGLGVKRAEIVDALRDLVEGGLAKAYTLSPYQPYSTEIKGMPPLDVVEEDFKTYFYVTNKGKELVPRGADPSFDSPTDRTWGP
jgi:hypothetical protein